MTPISVGFARTGSNPVVVDGFFFLGFYYLTSAFERILGTTAASRDQNLSTVQLDTTCMAIRHYSINPQILEEREKTVLVEAIL